MARPGAVVDLRVGEVLRLDDGRILVVMEEKRGNVASLRIIADKSVKIEFPNKAAHECAAVKGEHSCFPPKPPPHRVKRPS